MSEAYDVIVVGAGPAGSTAAKLLAGRGVKVLLLDRARFPRHKTCASWISPLVFERFPDLQPHLDELIETPFWGIEFQEQASGSSARVMEPKPSGYLSLRSKFDEGLRRLAVGAGAEFRGGVGFDTLNQDSEGVRVRLADGREERARILMGADGAASRVAFAAGFRKGWTPQDYVLCANEDVEVEEGQVREIFGKRFPFYVFLQYAGIQGYAWVFPKRRHICLGLGGRLGPNDDIRELYRRFFEDAKRQGLLPGSAEPKKVYYDLDPVGAVHRVPTLVRGRVVLVGDAGGFVSGTTGEGIYPGMVSAEVAVRSIEAALGTGRVPARLEEFNETWRQELGGYVKRLPGGEKEGKTRNRIGWIFRYGLVARMAARSFLYGEAVSFKTAFRCLLPWSQGMSCERGGRQGGFPKF